jgi:hypothetical protein
MSVSRAAVRCAAATTLVLTVAACSRSSHPPATAATKPSASASASESAQLTVAQVSSVFAAFLPKFNQLASDPSLASQLTTGPETMTEQYLKGTTGFRPGNLTGERFVIPYLTTYPRWFLAAGSASDGRGFMFVMVQQSAGAPWREAADLYDPGTAQIMPDLRYAGFASTGFAQAVSSSDPSLVVSPSGLPAAYSRYLDDLGRGPGRQNFGAGANTSNYVKLDEEATAGSAARGWHFADRQTPAGQPVYGVKLSTGVAMVIFYTRETITWTALSAGAALSQNEAVLYAPPALITARLHLSHTYPGLRVTATAIDENLAFVPTFGSGKVTVELNIGKAISFTKS